MRTGGGVGVKDVIEEAEELQLQKAPGGGWDADGARHLYKRGTCVCQLRDEESVCVYEKMYEEMCGCGADAF